MTNYLTGPRKIIETTRKTGKADTLKNKKNHKIVMCDCCGCLVNNTNLSKHKKTNKCKMLTQAKKEKELEDKLLKLSLHD